MGSSFYQAAALFFQFPLKVMILPLLAYFG